MSLSSRLRKLESTSGISGGGMFSFLFRDGEDSAIAKELAVKDFVSDGGDVDDIEHFIGVRHWGKSVPKDYKGNPMPSYQFIRGKK